MPDEPVVTGGEGTGSTPPPAPASPPAPAPPVTPPPTPPGTTEVNIDDHPRFRGLMSSYGTAQARIAELEGQLKVEKTTSQAALSETATALAEAQKTRETASAEASLAKGEAMKYQAIVKNQEFILPELYDLIPATTDEAAMGAALELAKEKSKAILERTRTTLAQGNIQVGTPPRTPPAREWTAQEIDRLSPEEWEKFKPEIMSWANETYKKTQ